MSLTTVPLTLEVLDKLRKNSHMGKHKHFFASYRGRLLHMWFGVPIVIINVLIGSTFFILLSKEIPTEAKWAGAIFALIAAVLGALQTFFHFHKTAESHRTVGNQYLGIARECERLIASYFDGLQSLAQLSDHLSDLNKRYEEVNTASEGLPTNNKDYLRAFAIEKQREAEQASLIDRIKQHPSPNLAVPHLERYVTN